MKQIWTSNRYTEEICFFYFFLGLKMQSKALAEFAHVENRCFRLLPAHQLMVFVNWLGGTSHMRNSSSHNSWVSETNVPPHCVLVVISKVGSLCGELCGWKQQKGTSCWGPLSRHDHLETPLLESCRCHPAIHASFNDERCRTCRLRRMSQVWILEPWHLGEWTGGVASINILMQIHIFRHKKYIYIYKIYIWYVYIYIHKYNIYVYIHTYRNIYIYIIYNWTYLWIYHISKNVDVYV